MGGVSVKVDVWKGLSSQQFFTFMAADSPIYVIGDMPYMCQAHINVQSSVLPMAQLPPKGSRINAPGNLESIIDSF